jgi:hypothetical protein
MSITITILTLLFFVINIFLSFSIAKIIGEIIQDISVNQKFTKITRFYSIIQVFFITLGLLSFGLSIRRVLTLFGRV